MGSIKDGTTIYYHKIPVGEILNYELSTDGKKVALNAHIKEQFTHLVRKNSRFWNASGVNISGDLSGFKVRTQSFLSMLSGGIAFDTPEDGEDDLPAANNDSFTLFKDYDDAQTGIMVEIHFKHGQGLVPDETKVKFEGAEVGIVKNVRFKVENDVFKGAIADVMFAPRAEKGLLDNTRFWLVKPEISLGGIKGIETLLTGAYINTQVQDLSKGKPARKFIALDQPPSINPQAPGLHFNLTASNLGSISKGTTIYYRKIPVGKVHNYQLSKSGDEVIMQSHIEEQYAHLVRSNSVFYNVSGINISGGLGGIKLKTESLASVIAGGIAFYNPLTTKTARAANRGSRFWLYDDYESAIESGLLIKITFASADGIKPGSTLIKYKGLTVGRVKDVKLNDDLKSVTVYALLDNAAREFAKEKTRFWIVRAKLGLSEVSGLETIVTGPYIELDPGSGPEKTRFAGLEQKPVDLRNTEGLRLVLEANELGSLSAGAPVYYKKVKVGEVESYKLSDSHKIAINIFIPQQYTNLVNRNSRFWNASGVEVEASLSKGLKVNTQSLKSIISGGISFETPQYDTNVITCKQGDIFTLYNDYNVIETKYHQPDKVYFKMRATHLGSLKANLPVYYRQIQVGKIEHYELANTADQIIITASVEEKYAPLVRTNSKFWNVSGFAVKFSLFGSKMETTTMESLLKGGIAFSTPNNKDMGKVADSDSVFEIYDEPQEDWIQWNPKIPLDGAVESQPKAPSQTQAQVAQQQEKESDF